MGILDGLLNNEGIKKAMFSKMAKTAKENGFNQVLITIGENGEFKADTLDKSMTVISQEEKDFLTKFYHQNKNK